MATHKTLKSPLKKSPLRSPSKIKYIKQQSVNSAQNLYEIVADNEEHTARNKHNRKSRHLSLALGEAGANKYLMAQ